VRRSYNRFDETGIGSSSLDEAMLCALRGRPSWIFSRTSAAWSPRSPELRFKPLSTPGLDERSARSHEQFRHEMDRRIRVRPASPWSRGVVIACQRAIFDEIVDTALLTSEPHYSHYSLSAQSIMEDRSSLSKSAGTTNSIAVF